MIINLARLSQRLSQSIHVFALQAPHRHLTVWGSHQRWHTKHRAWLELNMPRSMFWQIICVPPYEPKTTYQRIRERWPFNEQVTFIRNKVHVGFGRTMCRWRIPPSSEVARIKTNPTSLTPSPHPFISEVITDWVLVRLRCARDSWRVILGGTDSG